MDRIEFYGALWLFCSRYHSGQWSRGYRILSWLSRKGYRPGIGLQSGRFESTEQAECYGGLIRCYGDRI